MKTDLVYICLFHDTKYSILLKYLLESINFSCRNDKSFDIIIYTSSEIKRELVKTISGNERIIFHINDKILTKKEACSARLDIFEFPQIKSYKRILYLDTDIIIRKELNSIFNLISEDKLYSLKECENIFEYGTEFFGKSLFGDEIHNYRDKSGFNSGVLLFNNCSKIGNLFQIIKQDMVQRKDLMFFYDQPFIIYNTKKLNLCNNTTLANYVQFSHSQNNNEATILHFCGGVKVDLYKINAMKEYLTKLTKL
jgi:lipopolysaccharide biosynthesis glycosyltransferase